MPASRVTVTPVTGKCSKRKARSASGQLSVEPLSSRKCAECGKILSRRYDMPRHMKQHPSSGAKKIQCPWKDCVYKAHQLSNLATHYRTHTKDKPFKCPDCLFECGDPASLLRHRKWFHNYRPRSSNGRKSSKSTAPTHPRHKDSSPSEPPSQAPASGGSPFSVEPFLPLAVELFSPTSSSQLPTVNLPYASDSTSPFFFPPQHFIPLGESRTSFESSSSFNEFQVVPPVDSSLAGSNSSLHWHWGGLVHNSSPPCPYNHSYQWDTAQAFSGFNFLATEPNIEQFQSQIPWTSQTTQSNHWHEFFGHDSNQPNYIW